MPPQLPGYPDPLAGFTYSGPFGSVVRTLYLLGRRPIVWLGFGVTWAACYVGTTLLGNSIVGIVASLGTFGSLVAAGWFGWPRPWAYGAASAALGYVIFSLVLAVLALQRRATDQGPDSPVPGRRLTVLQRPVHDDHRRAGGLLRRLPSPPARIPVGPASLERPPPLTVGVARRLL